MPPAPIAARLHFNRSLSFLHRLIHLHRHSQIGNDLIFLRQLEYPGLLILQLAEPFRRGQGLQAIQSSGNLFMISLPHFAVMDLAFRELSQGSNDRSICEGNGLGVVQGVYVGIVLVGSDRKFIRPKEKGNDLFLFRPEEIIFHGMALGQEDAGFAVRCGSYSFWRGLLYGVRAH